MSNMPVSFKVVICGAGIGGLCAAIGLARKGHEVLVLESHHELSEVGLGIHVPTNATRILQAWGVLDRLRATAVLGGGQVTRRYADSSELLRQVQHSGDDTPDALPYYTMHRHDYQRGLYEAALEAGAEIRFSAKVAEVDEDAPSVTLTTGERIAADLLVGADGIKSTIRAKILPDEDVEPIIRPMVMYRALATRKALQAEPSLAPYLASPQTNVWVGYRRMFIIYPLRGGESYMVGGLHPGRPAEIGRWNTPADLAAIRRHYAAFDEPVRAILRAAEHALDWGLAEAPRLPTWRSASRRVVLLGDAAHAMLPFMGQGAAMATEDGAALAECVARAAAVAPSGRDDGGAAAAAAAHARLPAALAAFERARHYRAERVQSATRLQGEVLTLGDGVEQEARDRRLAGQARPDDVEVEGMDFLVDSAHAAWIYGYDAFAGAKQALDAAGL